MRVTCEVCNRQEATIHRAAEMMFGLGDAFDYSECCGCGRLRLIDPPKDWSRYYPQNYYSFQPRRISSLKTAALFSHRLGLRPPMFVSRVAQLLNLHGRERILDVGGGSGQVAKEMCIAGYKALSADAYIQQESPYAKRATLAELDGGWDRIMFNHSLEHIDDQVAELSRARSLLSPGGLCLVRIPIAEVTWKRYGVNWVQLDCPRHICVHSVKSFRVTAAAAGFKVLQAVGDSGAFQFWGSELYRAGVPLVVGEKQLSKYFTKKQMSQFKSDAAALNQDCLGDAAAFVLAVGWR